jgi:hypothetical protein
MRQFTRIMVAAIVVFGFLITLSAVQGQSTSVGVKKGNWVEYSVSATGTPPPEQNLNWARIEILDVEGSSFHANVTVRYVNGTFSSGVRLFNFSAGQVQAWIIIPAHLNPGDYFYDSGLGNNVTIQGQLHKTVAGADRLITYTNTTERNKEWDKATGVYTQSDDYLENYTIHAKATATNMWVPQILGLDQTLFYSLFAGVIVAIVVVVSIVVVTWKKKWIKH